MDHKARLLAERTHLNELNVELKENVNLYLTYSLMLRHLK
jgi:hypothetical protein